MVLSGFLKRCSDCRQSLCLGLPKSKEEKGLESKQGKEMTELIAKLCENLYGSTSLSLLHSCMLANIGLPRNYIEA